MPDERRASDQIPAVTGVQPDAPNARRADDDGLAQGPPPTDERADVETGDPNGGSAEMSDGRSGRSQ